MKKEEEEAKETRETNWLKCNRISRCTFHFQLFESSFFLGLDFRLMVFFPRDSFFQAPNLLLFYNRISFLLQCFILSLLLPVFVCGCISLVVHCNFRVMHSHEFHFQRMFHNSSFHIVSDENSRILADFCCLL